MKVNVKLHPAQREVIAHRRRFNVLACGRRWGKSRMAFGLALETVAQKGSVAYACPAAEDYAKRWDEAVEFFAPVARQFHVADGVIEFMNGRRMEWFGLHRDTGIRGNKYHRFIIDEAAHSPKLESAWTLAIRATLSDYRGDAYFMSTPNGANYFKALFERRQTDETWAAFQMPTSSNPYIDPDEIEDARRTLPSIVFRQEYLAEFVDMQGSRVKREWLRYGTPPANLRYSMAVDLAASLRSEADYTAIVVTGTDGSGNYWVVDVHRDRMSFNDIISRIRSYAAKWNPDVIGVENVQAQAYIVQELIRTTMLPVVPITPDKDKVSRFMPVEGKLEHGHITLAPNLDPAFESELLSFPHGEHDDMVDAFTYSMLGHEQSYSIISL